MAARSRPATKPVLQPTARPPTERINPFQVYAVRGLSELRDVRTETVLTPEFQEVARVVHAYVDAFDTTGGPLAKLLLAARGDFGTGKTHLMQFAGATLAFAWAERNPKSEPERPAPYLVMAASIEAPIEDWYASELGPTLIEVTSPRELIRQLLTEIACQVAEDDLDPEIRALADQFRVSRKTLYDLFRDPGAFDISAVETRFVQAINEACPRTSGSFRRALSALRWEETAEAVEDWLAGNELSQEDMARLGIRLDGDRANRAANAICAIAAISRKLGRPFALFIDEFEHLSRYDLRNRSKRNITWMKRLVESLARRGSMVFISGHWEAWKQQGDFLDRFVGGRPIQLVRLTAQDVMDVVQVRAGADAWPGFTTNAARSVVEVTSGNIRRVMTVLYDLWSDPEAPSKVVQDDAIRVAAQRRLQPGSELGIMPAIEAAVRSVGAVLARDETFGQPPTAVDATARLNSQLRLLVQLVHARDEVALFDKSSRFAQLVKEVRLTSPQVRGLCVTVGAVIEKHIITLDAAFPETDLVSGEDANIVAQLPDIVKRALTTTPAAVEGPTATSIKDLGTSLAEVVGRADAQIARGQEVFGEDSRSDAVRRSSLPDFEELANQKQMLARGEFLDEIRTGAASGITRKFASALVRQPISIIICALGFLFLFFRSWLYNLSDSIPALRSPLIVPALITLTLTSFGVSVFLCVRLLFDVIEFRDVKIQILRRLEAEGASVWMLSTTNEKLQSIYLQYGPREARVRAVEAIEDLKVPVKSAYDAAS